MVKFPVFCRRNVAEIYFYLMNSQIRSIYRRRNVAEVYLYLINIRFPSAVVPETGAISILPSIYWSNSQYFVAEVWPEI